MREVLITFGDSFTWGEGLDSYLISEMFPDWSSKMREMTERDDKPNEIQRLKYKLTTSIPQLTFRRIESTYGYLLNEKLGTTHISNGVNGGFNIDRLVDLDYFIKAFEMASDTKPKYCIFQLTHVCRDIQHIFEHKWSDDINKVVDSTFPQRYRDAVEGKDYFQWEHLGLFSTALRYIVCSIEERFKTMENLWGTKCFFFLGLGEPVMGPTIREYLYKNPHFIPMMWEGKEYATFSEIGRLEGLSIKDTVGFHDAHCDNSLHKWLSEYLYEHINKQ